MKGFRFYFESTHEDQFVERRLRKLTRKEIIANPVGNVVAVEISKDGMPELWSCNNEYTALSALYFQSNSPVAWGGVGRDYLANYATRISEKLARQIHPTLFKYLDAKS